MLPMICPRCSSKRHCALATNSQMPEQTVRQRLCTDCAHRWYTVEVTVPNTAIGWEAAQRAQSKPVLREAVRVELLGTERRKPGRPAANVTECDSPDT